MKNKHIELITKWLKNRHSVPVDDLEVNAHNAQMAFLAADTDDDETITEIVYYAAHYAHLAAAYAEDKAEDLCKSYVTKYWEFFKCQ